MAQRSKLLIQRHTASMQKSRVLAHHKGSDMRSSLLDQASWEETDSKESEKKKYLKLGF